MASIRSSNVNGSSVDYAWDATNHLVSVTDNRIADGTMATTYAMTGRPSRTVQPSGVTVNYEYDNMNRLTSLLWSKGMALASWTSSYSPRGQRVTSVELSGRHVTYGYDTVSRLASETITSDPAGADHDGTIQYSLDSGREQGHTNFVPGRHPVSRLHLRRE